MTNPAQEFLDSLDAMRRRESIRQGEEPKEVADEDRLIIRLELPGWKGINLAAIGAAIRALGDAIGNAENDGDPEYFEPIDIGWFRGAEVEGEDIIGSVVFDIHAIAVDKRYAEELGLVQEEEEDD
jgi:hypothetical protein